MGRKLDKMNEEQGEEKGHKTFVLLSRSFTTNEPMRALKGTLHFKKMWDVGS